MINPAQAGFSALKLIYIRTDLDSCSIIGTLELALPKHLGRWKELIGRRVTGRSRFL